MSARCLVIGCGSIGSRRARILAEMGHEVEVCDPLRPVRAAKFGRLVDLDEVLMRRPGALPDAAFICTPAATHVEIAGQCVMANVPTFVEKPLSLTMDGIDDLISEAEARGVVTMGACNMRWAYREAVGAVADDLALCIARPLSQWRPGAREAYAPGGLVLEAAIHEMDLAHQILGDIEDVYSMGSHEAAVINLRHARGECRIYASWAEGEPCSRWLAAGPDRFYPDTSDEMYRLEMQHFLDCVAENRPTCNPLRSAAHVLEWAIKAQEQIRMVGA